MPLEILLIEDNPADAKLTWEALQETEIMNHLIIMPSGIEAMAFLHHEGQYVGAPLPDLIVMDVHLPRMGGFEILAEIQADSRLNQIPVVVLTGSIDADERAELKKWPIWRQIVKPCDLNDYIACIKSLLDDFHSR